MVDLWVNLVAVEQFRSDSDLQWFTVAHSNWLHLLLARLVKMQIKSPLCKMTEMKGLMRCANVFKWHPALNLHKFLLMNRFVALAVSEPWKLRLNRSRVIFFYRGRWWAETLPKPPSQSHSLSDRVFSTSKRDSRNEQKSAEIIEKLGKF